MLPDEKCFSFQQQPNILYMTLNTYNSIVNFKQKQIEERKND